MSLGADVIQTFRTIALEDYSGLLLMVSPLNPTFTGNMWRQESSFVFAGEHTCKGVMKWVLSGSSLFVHLFCLAWAK